MSPILSFLLDPSPIIVYHCHSLTQCSALFSWFEWFDLAFEEEKKKFLDVVSVGLFLVSKLKFGPDFEGTWGLKTIFAQHKWAIILF